MRRYEDYFYVIKQINGNGYWSGSLASFYFDDSKTEFWVTDINKAHWFTTMIEALELLEIYGIYGKINKRRTLDS